jgi:50S ribosomal protein L16 3-hydroxylase
MDIQRPTALLGGLTPAAFMRQHWQKKPLLIRQAWPGVQPPMSRAALFNLAGAEGVESRLLSRSGGDWRLRQGPFARRALPPLKQPDWTLLVQGLDLHCQPAHEMLQRFRFVPEARLDDLMISYASPGGGVGPHLDSYDVFLLQVHGQRRWRVGPVADRSLVPGLPVRILANFEPSEEWLLNPGDMLYLPPLCGHDGTAEGECMTCSIGFRAASQRQLGQELLHQLADGLDEEGRADTLYRDAGQGATDQPGRMPARLAQFAARALSKALRDPLAIDHALGILMTEPKPQVWFDAGTAWLPGQGLALDRRSRMIYDDHHVFINGEAFRASGRDASCMHILADTRHLAPADAGRLSAPARALLADWVASGWLHALGEN